MLSNTWKNSWFLVLLRLTKSGIEYVILARSSLSTVKDITLQEGSLTPPPGWGTARGIAQKQEPFSPWLRYGCTTRERATLSDRSQWGARGASALDGRVRSVADAVLPIETGLGQLAIGADS